MRFWQAVSLGSWLLGWLARASADGKISAPELLEALEHISQEFGLELEVNVGSLGTPPPSPPFGPGEWPPDTRQLGTPVGRGDR